MKGILFDMDGVLIDAMPFHAESFQTAFKETVDKDIDKKEIFLLEGMPGHQLVKEIFKRNNDDRYINDENIINTICKRKEQIFKEIQKAKAFEGVKELIDFLNCNNCLKAVVSGASKQEVESLLNANSLNNFNLIFSGEGLKDGKPHPEPFPAALDKLNLKPTEAVIVENAPLGVESAIRAGVRYIITLNNTPLELSDFKSLLPKNKNDIDKIVFKDTKSASKYLNDWCCK